MPFQHDLLNIHPLVNPLLSTGINTLNYCIMSKSELLVMVSVLAVCASVVFVIVLDGEQMKACMALFGVGVLGCIAGAMMAVTEEERS